MSRLLTDKPTTCVVAHICDWCGEDIPAGAKAQYRTWVSAGRFYAAYQHPECCKAMYLEECYDDERNRGGNRMRTAKYPCRGCGLRIEVAVASVPLCKSCRKIIGVRCTHKGLAWKCDQCELAENQTTIETLEALLDAKEETE